MELAVGRVVFLTGSMDAVTNCAGTMPVTESVFEVAAWRQFLHRDLTIACDFECAWFIRPARLIPHYLHALHWGPLG